MLAHLGDGVATTLNDVHDAIGNARLLEQVNEDLGGTSDALGRLHHIGVSESDRERVHPERDHSWEVVWADTTHHTEGLTVGVNIDAASNTLGALALSEGGE